MFITNIRISKELVKGDSYEANAGNGAMAAPGIIEEALASGSMTLPEMETIYLPVLLDELSAIPGNESDFVEMMLPLIDIEVIPVRKWLCLQKQ